MTTYTIPEAWPFRPGDSIDDALAWAAQQGVDGKRIVRSGFRITEGVDGSLTASGHLFDLDENGKRIVLAADGETATFAKAPFSVPVSSVPTFVEVAA